MGESQGSKSHGVNNCKRKRAKKHKRQQKYGIKGMRLNNPSTIKERSLVKIIIQQSLAYLQQNIETAGLDGKRADTPTKEIRK